MPETLTDQQLRDAIVEAVKDGDRFDAWHYARRWVGVTEYPATDRERLYRACLVTIANTTGDERTIALIRKTLGLPPGDPV